MVLQFTGVKVTVHQGQGYTGVKVTVHRGQDYGTQFSH